MVRRLGRRRVGRRRPVRRGGRGRGRGRVGRSRMPAMAGKGQYATIIETIEFDDILSNTVNQYVFQLGQFPRANQLAANFAFHKACHVEWKYEPLYNTFQDSAGALSKPYLYTLMNRQQENEFTNINTQNFGAIQAAGAKAVALASTHVIKYVPNWCSPGLIATTAGGAPFALGLQKQYGWLATPTGSTSTNTGPSNNVVVRVIDPPIQNTALAPVGNYANAVVYNGHLSYLDQKVASTTSTPIARVTATVMWKFKGAFCRLLEPTSNQSA